MTPIYACLDFFLASPVRQTAVGTPSIWCLHGDSWTCLTKETRPRSSDVLQLSSVPVMPLVTWNYTSTLFSPYVTTAPMTPSTRSGVVLSYVNMRVRVFCLRRRADSLFHVIWSITCTEALVSISAFIRVLYMFTVHIGEGRVTWLVCLVYIMKCVCSLTRMSLPV